MQQFYLRSAFSFPGALLLALQVPPPRIAALNKLASFRKGGVASLEA